MWRDSLLSNDAKVKNINRSDFEKLLRATLRNKFFTFEGKIHKKIVGDAKGSPLGPTLANAFLCFHEPIWYNECPDEFQSVYYRRYVNDIFVLFYSTDHLKKFKNYLNPKHRNIRFICKEEHKNSMPFLDVLITRTSNGFKTPVYLCTTNPYLVEYIQISTASFTKNIMLVWFSVYYFEGFQLFRIF